MQNWNTGKAAFIGYGADITSAKINIENGYYLQGTVDNAVYKKEDSDYGISKIQNLEYSEMTDKLNSYIETENKSDWKKWDSNAQLIN